MAETVEMAETAAVEAPETLDAEDPAAKEKVDGEKMEDEDKTENAEKEKPEEELEQDDLPDKRKSFLSVKNAVSTELSNHDSMINTCVSEGRVAQCLDHSFPFLYGAVRATRGIKKGRYFYEVQVVSSGPKHAPEFRVGFSTKGSNLLGRKTSIFFDSQGSLHKGEEKVYNFKRFTTEVVGVLLNLNKDSPCANTVSLFIDGVRVCAPVPLPDDMKDVTLFPHVMPKYCAVAVNFLTPMCTLPFKARMMDEAPKDDVEDGVKPPKEAEIVIPFGGNCVEWATEFCAKNPECMLLTQDFVKQWAKESGGHNTERVFLIQDGGKTICRVMNHRKRRYVYAFGSIMTSEERIELCKRFSTMKKTCYVNWTSEPSVQADFEKASLPTEEEGFHKVIFEKKKEEVEEELQAWKKKSKLHSIVDNFKMGSFLKEKYAEYEALKKAYRHQDNEEEEDAAAEEEEKPQEGNPQEENPQEEKKEELPAEQKPQEEVKEGEEKDAEIKEEEKEGEQKEEKVEPPKKIETPTDVSEWTEEDWMLADLRVELHLLCHAFCDDVDDEERFAFSVTYLNHYYRIYFSGKNIRADTYACESFPELVSSLLDDTVEVKDQMLIPILPKEESMEKFIEMTEEVRNMRTERVGAGDETAALKFKATSQVAANHHRRPYSSYPQNRAGKGYDSRNYQYGSKGGYLPQERFLGPFQGRQGFQGQIQQRSYGGYGQPYAQPRQSYHWNNDLGPRQYEQAPRQYDQRQQWAGVKRDYPSGGFQAQQPRRY